LEQPAKGKESTICPPCSGLLFYRYLNEKGRNSNRESGGEIVLRMAFSNCRMTSLSNTSVTIEGHTLKAGMYLYTLIADGKEVDTKRMILTK
jgi:hypothetical protein